MRGTAKGGKSFKTKITESTKFTKEH